MRSSCRCCRWSASLRRRWRGLPRWRPATPTSKLGLPSSDPPPRRRGGGKPPAGPAGPKPPRPSRPGVGRMLHPDPDRVVDATLAACPHCAAAFPVAQQAAQQVYDRIELPPIRPDVTRVRLFGGRCACCGERAMAADRQQATSVLASFRQLAGGRTVKIAPRVMWLIDPEMVVKLRAAAEIGSGSL